LLIRAREGRADTATSAIRAIRLSRLVTDVADSILRIAERGDDGARAVGATDDDDDVGVIRRAILALTHIR